MFAGLATPPLFMGAPPLKRCGCVGKGVLAPFAALPVSRPHTDPSARSTSTAATAKLLGEVSPRASALPTPPVVTPKVLWAPAHPVVSAQPPKTPDGAVHDRSPAPQSRVPPPVTKSNPVPPVITEGDGPASAPRSDPSAVPGSPARGADGPHAGDVPGGKRRDPPDPTRQRPDETRHDYLMRMAFQKVTRLAKNQRKPEGWKDPTKPTLAEKKYEWDKSGAEIFSKRDLVARPIPPVLRRISTDPAQGRIDRQSNANDLRHYEQVVAKTERQNARTMARAYDKLFGAGAERRDRQKADEKERHRAQALAKIDRQNEREARKLYGTTGTLTDSMGREKPARDVLQGHVGPGAERADRQAEDKAARHAEQQFDKKLRDAKRATNAARRAKGLKEDHSDIQGGSPKGKRAGQVQTLEIDFTNPRHFDVGFQAAKAPLKAKGADEPRGLTPGGYAAFVAPPQTDGGSPLGPIGTLPAAKAGGEAGSSVMGPTQLAPFMPPPTSPDAGKNLASLPSATVGKQPMQVLDVGNPGKPSLGQPTQPNFEGQAPSAPQGKSSAPGVLTADDYGGKPAGDRGAGASLGGLQQERIMSAPEKGPTKPGFVPRQSGAAQAEEQADASPTALPPPGGAVALTAMGKASAPVQSAMVSEGGGFAAGPGLSRPLSGASAPGGVPTRPAESGSGWVQRQKAAAPQAGLKALAPGGAIPAGLLPGPSTTAAPAVRSTAGMPEAQTGAFDDDYFAALRAPVTPPQPILRGKVDSTRQLMPEGSARVGDTPRRARYADGSDRRVRAHMAAVSPFGARS